MNARAMIESRSMRWPIFALACFALLCETGCATWQQWVRQSPTVPLERVPVSVPAANALRGSGGAAALHRALQAQQDQLEAAQ
jgi:hypothetical protein